MNMKGRLVRSRKNYAKTGAIQEALRRAGLVLTLARIQILSIFYEEEKASLTVHEIFDHCLHKDLDVSFGSIYKIVYKFEEVGLLTSRNFEHSKYYELKRSPETGVIKCTRCGHYSDFESTKLIEACKETVIQLGFSPDKLIFSVSALCDDCKEN